MKNVNLIFSLALVFALLSETVSANTSLANNTAVSLQQLKSKSKDIISQYSASDWFSGNVAIYKEGQLVFNQSYGLADIANNIKNTNETKIRIGSINKHYTAVLIMQKVQAGQLALTDKLAKFDLGFDNHIANKITVAHLLRHTSGFGDIFNDEYFKTYQSLKTINDKLPLLIDKPLISEPGKDYNYSNYGYIVLGAILEKLEQKPFDVIIKENILDVIGAKNTDYALTDKVTGKARSYHFTPLGDKVDRTVRLENLTPDGGMYATASDLSLFYSKLFYSNELLNDNHKAVIGNGYKDRSRTWSEILQSDKARWRAYGGGPGVSAAVEVLIKDKLMVVVLANTDGLVAEHISQRIVQAYKTNNYEKVVLPVALFVNGIIKDKGSAFFKNNAKVMLKQGGYHDITPRPLNKMAFNLLNTNKSKDALNVFIANTKLFPNEANPFDSLAYAYEKLGDTKQALINYNKALTIDPNFTSAKEGIDRLSN